LQVVVAPETNGVAAGNGPDGSHSTIVGMESQIYATGGTGGRKSILLSPYPNGGTGGSAANSYGDCTASGQNGLNGFRVTATIPIPVPTPTDGAGGAGATTNGGAGGSPVGEIIGNGNPGSAPGGGGSGSRSSATLTFNTTGGSGAAGRVVVYYVCPEITSAGEIEGEQVICYNTIPAEIQNKTAATATAGNIDYQWQSSTVSGTDGFADVTSAAGTSYTSGALSQTTWFRRLAKPRCSSTWPANGESNVIEVTIRPEFSAGSIETAGEEICSGINPGVIGSASLPSGGDASFSYQWQSSADGSFTSATDITGATASAYDPSALTSTTYFRRLDKDGTCNEFTPATGSWQITVFAPSVGGSTTGGTSVCYGSNSTELGVSGNTGTVQNWHYSLNGTSWTQISGATNITYTAENLTASTWYRVGVKNGGCELVYSSPAQIIVIFNYKISGVAQYENNPKTPLDGLKITLKKDGAPLGNYTTTSNGYYEFTGLVNGNYSLEVSSASPSGQWQTWGGVNNTDAQLVYNHYMNIMQLPVNPPVVRIAASVKQAHPDILNNDYVAIRQAAKFGWGYPPYFDLPKWVFSGETQALSITDFQLNCANVTRNIRGLCAGDVNGTNVPGAGFKAASDGINLMNSGLVACSREMVFPVNTMNAMEVGAATLVLHYDPLLITITDVNFPDAGADKPDFFAENGLLFIGWNSTKPVTLNVQGTMFLIRASLNGNFGQNAENYPELIRFTLAGDVPSEIADRTGNMIQEITFVIPDGGKKAKPVMDAEGQSMIVSMYPNPAQDVVNLLLSLTNEEPVKLQVIDIHGVVLRNYNVETLGQGLHSLKLDVQGLSTGIHFLNVQSGNTTLTRKLIIKNR
jgi:hypothetical protein